MRATAGQSLSEYGLVCALVGVAAVGGLVLLGGSLDDALKNIWGQPSALQFSATASGNSGTSANSSHPAPGMQEVTITLENGKTITLPQYPADLGRTVQTIGVNGSTDLLAQNMKAMADAMLAAGEITPEQANGLIRLANQGHRIAEMEKAWEAAAANGPADSASDPIISFEGKMYTPDEFSTMTGYYTQQKVEVRDFSNEPTIGELKTFQDLYKTVQNSGVLSEPSVQATVLDLFSQIAFLQESSNYTGDSVFRGETPPTEMTKKIASDTNDKFSAGICDTGKGKDSGVQCSG